MISIMSQITLQFDMLAQNIRELQPNDMQGIIKITLMHIRLIEVSQQFARLISRTVFLNHILSSMGCSIGLFQVVITEDMGEKFRFIVYLLCVLLQTFNMSFIGDLLIEHVSVFISCEITLNFSHLEFESCPSCLWWVLDRKQQADAIEFPANYPTLPETTFDHWIGILHNFHTEFL